MIVYDLIKDFNCTLSMSAGLLRTANYSGVTRDSLGRIKVTTATTDSSYLFFSLPDRYPEGTVIEIEADVQKISGSSPRASIDIFQYGVGQNTPTLPGAQTQAYGGVPDNSSTDFQRVTAIGSTTAIYPYARALIGFFGTTQGSFLIRSLIVKVHYTPANIKGLVRSQSYNSYDLTKFLNRYTSSSSTSIYSVTTNGVTLTTPDDTTESFLRSLTYSGFYHTCAPGDVIELSVLANVTKGNLCIGADLRNASGTLISKVRNIAPLNSGVDMYHRVRFVVPDFSDSTVARYNIVIGKDSAQPAGVTAEIKSVSFAQYSNKSSADSVPQFAMTGIGCAIRNDASGNFYIDNDSAGRASTDAYSRFSSNGFSGTVTTGTNNIVLSYSGTITPRPIISVTLDDSGGLSALYYPCVTMQQMGSLTIYLRKRADNTLVALADLPKSSVLIQISGLVSNL